LIKNQSSSKIAQLWWSSNQTVSKVPIGAKVPLLTNCYFLSSAYCVLVASVFGGRGLVVAGFEGIDYWFRYFYVTLFLYN